jgi:hypothetical protein
LGKAEAQGASKYPYFEEETSVEVVNARMGPDVDPRLLSSLGICPPLSDELMGKIRDIYTQDIKPYVHQRW